jgi:hypothetical protein
VSIEDLKAEMEALKSKTPSFNASDADKARETMGAGASTRTSFMHGSIRLVMIWFRMARTSYSVIWGDLQIPFTAFRAAIALANLAPNKPIKETEIRSSNKESPEIDG